MLALHPVGGADNKTDWSLHHCEVSKLRRDKVIYPSVRIVRNAAIMSSNDWRPGIAFACLMAFKGSQGWKFIHCVEIQFLLTS